MDLCPTMLTTTRTPPRGAALFCWWNFFVSFPQTKIVREKLLLLITASYVEPILLFMVFSKICLLIAFLSPVAVTANAWYQDHYGAGVLNAASSLPDNLDFDNAPESTINHLSSIRDSEYTALTHPRFPNHRVRIKKSNFCDPTVKLVLFYCHPITLTISLFIQVTLMC